MAASVEIGSFVAALREVYTGTPISRQMVIPVRLSPEARARRGWNDAVAWLEAREAARREWPWPGRP